MTFNKAVCHTCVSYRTAPVVKIRDSWLRPSLGLRLDGPPALDSGVQTACNGSLACGDMSRVWDERAGLSCHQDLSSFCRGVDAWSRSTTTLPK